MGSGMWTGGERVLVVVRTGGRRGENAEGGSYRERGVISLHSVLFCTIDCDWKDRHILRSKGFANSLTTSFVLIVA